MRQKVATGNAGKVISKYVMDIRQSIEEPKKENEWKFPNLSSNIPYTMPRKGLLTVSLPLSHLFERVASMILDEKHTISASLRISMEEYFYSFPRPILVNLLKV